MHRSILAAGVVAVGLSGAALADDSKMPSYNYLEANFLNTAYSSGLHSSFIPIDQSGSGYELKGSMEVNDRFHAFVDHFIDHHHEAPLFEYRVTEMGFGGQFATSDHSSAFINASLLQTRVVSQNATVSNRDGDGIRLELGVRGKFTPHWEADTSVRYASVANVSSDLSWTLSGRYLFNDYVALQAGAELSSNINIYKAGVRLYFK